MRKLVLIMILGLSLLFAGCSGVDLSGVNLSNISEEDVNKFIVCNDPYIRHGTGCCLDQNENNICDNDEASVSDSAKTTGYAEEEEEFEKDHEHDELDLDIYIEIFKEEAFTKVYVEFEDEEELFFEFETTDLGEVKEMLAKELDLSYDDVVYHSEVEYEYYDDHKHDEEHDELDLELELEYREGKVILEWDDYTEDDFKYYKVMFSTEIEDPKYPEDDAIGVIDDIDETEFTHYDFSEKEENFYRISVVTSSGIYYHSDVVEFFLDSYERDIEIDVEIFKDGSVIEVEIDGEDERIEVSETDKEELIELIAKEFDLTIDEVEKYAEFEYDDSEEEEEDDESDEEDDETDEEESQDDEEENTNSSSN